MEGARSRRFLVGGVVSFLVLGFAVASSGAMDLLPSPQARMLLAAPRVEEAALRAASLEDVTLRPMANAVGGSTEAGPKVSRRKAFFLSLLLPGLGQRANGHYGRAKVFMGLEACIWTGAAMAGSPSFLRSGRR